MTYEHMAHAIAQDETLRNLFAQAELWRELAKTPGIPEELKQEAQENARNAYDRAEERYNTTR